MNSKLKTFESNFYSNKIQPKSIQQKQFDGIQALRFVAAVLVVLMHSTHYVSERLVKDVPIFSNGSAGVDIFFVISGFVMIISSQSLLNRSDGWELFTIRRLLRIVPLYWALLALKVATLVLLPSALTNKNIDPIAILCSFLFLPSYNPEGMIAPILVVGWTLNFEMFFYFLLAIAMKIRINPFKIVGTVFAILCLLAFFRKPDWPAISFYLDTIVLEFGFGMLIAHAILRGLTISRSMCIALIVLGIAGLAPVWETNPFLTRPLVWGVPAALIVLGTACLNSTLTGRVPRFLLLLGNASYALYLIHPLVGPFSPSILAKLGIPSAGLSVFMSLVTSVAVSLIVFLVAERPVTNFLRNRFEARPTLGG